MSLLEQLAALVAPFVCLVCKREGEALCDECSLITLKLPGEHCYRCLAYSRDNAVCEACIYNSSLRHVWPATNYSGLAKQLVHDFKFSHARGYDRVLARAILRVLPPLDHQTLVTFVPTAASRQRGRGFDHAERLAKTLAKLQSLRCLPLIERVGAQRQVGATRDQRLTQLEGAFRPVRPYLFQGTPILLIDDVLTTGGSLEAAARVLLTAGAQHVDAAVFARTR